MDDKAQFFPIKERIYMRTYVRESVKIGDHTRVVSRYTPSEYIILNIPKFLFFLFIVWPLQIIWFVIKLPFKLIFKLIRKFYTSSLPVSAKIIITIIFLVVLGLLAAFGNSTQ